MKWKVKLIISSKIEHFISAIAAFLPSPWWWLIGIAPEHQQTTSVTVPDLSLPYVLGHPTFVLQFVAVDFFPFPRDV